MLRRLLPRRLSHEEEATLVEHLSELRHRLFIALLSIVPGFALGYAFHTQIIEWLMDLLPEGTQLVTLGVTEPFFTSLKVSFYVGIAIALPVLLWQVWAFLAPAMNPATQRVIALFVVIATFLFAAGLAFMYVIVLPRALDFLVGYDDQLYAEQVRASYFLSFVTLTMLAGGIAFQMPIFVLALVRIGVLTSGTLRRNRRIGYVSMLVFAILLPTVDPISLAFEVGPLLVLYELSIWLSALMERRWERPFDETFEAS
jgi:sec-independent protein translocase protein TatC